MARHDDWWGYAIGAALGVGAAAVWTMSQPRAETLGRAVVHLRPWTFDGWTFFEVVQQDTYRLRGTALPANAAILDVGCNTGIFAAYASALWCDARVYGYEVDAGNLARAALNTADVGDRVRLYLATVVGDAAPTCASGAETIIRTTSDGGACDRPLPPPLRWRRSCRATAWRAWTCSRWTSKGPSTTSWRVRRATVRSRGSTASRWSGTTGASRNSSRCCRPRSIST